MRSSKPKKIICEVCGSKEKKILHHHHIIPRTHPDCTNDWDNLAVVCPNCHMSHHSGTITILGVVESTSLTGRLLIFIKDGIKNVDIDIPIRHKRKVK